MLTEVKNKKEAAIYEMISGKPVYYKNYQSYIKGDKSLEEIMGSSFLQSLIVTELVFLLKTHAGNAFHVLTNELGLQIGTKAWRAADIAVVAKEKTKNQAQDKYLKIAPELVIEVDTKADLSEIDNPLGYYYEKTDDLLKFGVKKVIWIFTNPKKVMVAEAGKRWETSTWSDEILWISGYMDSLDKILSES